MHEVLGVTDQEIRVGHQAREFRLDWRTVDNHPLTIAFDDQGLACLDDLINEPVQVRA